MRQARVAFYFFLISTAWAFRGAYASDTFSAKHLPAFSQTAIVSVARPTSSGKWLQLYTPIVYSPNPIRPLQVGRLLGDYTTDPAFPPREIPLGTSTYDQAVDLQVYSDDRFLVTANRSFRKSQTGEVLLARFLPDGELDTSFGEEGYLHYTSDFGVQDFAVASTLRPSGGIELFVITTSDNRNYRPKLVRFTETGDIDTTYGEGGVSEMPFLTGTDKAVNCLFRKDGSTVVAAADVDGGEVVLYGVDANGKALANFGTAGLSHTGLKITDAITLAEGKAGAIVLLGGNDQGARTELSVFTAEGAWDTRFSPLGKPVLLPEVNHILYGLYLDERALLAVRGDRILVLGNHALGNGSMQLSEFEYYAVGFDGKYVTRMLKSEHNDHSWGTPRTLISLPDRLLLFCSQSLAFGEAPDSGFVAELPVLTE